MRGGLMHAHLRQYRGSWGPGSDSKSGSIPFPRTIRTGARVRDPVTATAETARPDAATDRPPREEEASICAEELEEEEEEVEGAEDMGVVEVNDGRIDDDDDDDSASGSAGCSILPLK